MNIFVFMSTIHLCHEHFRFYVYYPLVSWTVSFSCLRLHSCHEQSHSRVYDATHVINSLVFMSTIHSCHEQSHSHVYDATRVMNIFVFMSTIHLCHEHFRFYVNYPLVSWTFSFSCLLSTRVMNSLILVSTMPLVSWTVSFSCLWCHSCHEQSQTQVYNVIKHQ